MHRRQWLKTAAGAALLARSGGALAGPLADPQVEAAATAGRRGLPPLKITDVMIILTAPAGIRLAVVKVLTSEPGLYGLGCATFTQRIRAVETALQHYLRPFLIGKDPTNIEDLWQSSFVSSYWRNGPVLNNALSGVDMAAWDILGKRAGLPLYELLGGKCRTAVEVYRHASGRDFQQVEESVRRFMAQGYRYIRAQVAVPGMSTYGAGGSRAVSEAPPNQRTETWEPAQYVRLVPRLFDHLRKSIG